jgi:hypothetical protein
LPDRFFPDDTNDHPVGDWLYADADGIVVSAKPLA